METLTELFKSRVDAFLERTGVGPSTLGRQAVRDPNLVRELRDGRSPTLALADRIHCHPLGPQVTLAHPGMSTYVNHGVCMAPSRQNGDS